MLIESRTYAYESNWHKIDEYGIYYQTRYLFANNSCNRRKVWSNDKKCLHDPKRFKIV